MDFCSALLRHACVVVRCEISVHAAVGRGWHAVERRADAFDVISRERIHNNTPATSCDTASDIGGDALLLFHVVLQLRPVERRDNAQRVLQPQRPRNISLNCCRRRSSQGNDGYTWQLRAQTVEFPVLGPEVVPPFAHAVRLVHRHQRDSAERMQLLQRGHDVAQRFRRGVKEVVGAGGNICDGGCSILRVGIEEAGAYRRVRQRHNLVLHQRQQRGYHQGQLAADRMAA